MEAVHRCLKMFKLQVQLLTSSKREANAAADLSTMSEVPQAFSPLCEFINQRKLLLIKCGATSQSNQSADKSERFLVK